MVHGQVKQSSNFAFARIYESGHEVPFYQPLASLEIFDRAIHGKDFATGMVDIEKGCGYKSVGTPTSEYREGNATVQFEVLPSDATYNTTTNMPNPYSKKNETASSGGMKKQQKRAFKPTLQNRQQFGKARRESRLDL